MICFYVIIVHSHRFKKMLLYFGTESGSVEKVVVSIQVYVH